MKKNRITVRLTESQLKQIQSHINTKGVSSVSDCVRIAIDYWLRNQAP